MAAFPNFVSDDYAVTPFRKTRVIFGLPEYRKVRQSWSQNFRGRAMSTNNGAPAGRNLNVYLLPSGSWCIASWEMQMQFERTECEGNLIIPGADPNVDLAPGFEKFGSQSTIPGVNYDPSVVPLGSYWARKRVPAGSDWHAELTADRGAFIPPAFPTQNADMRRVAHQNGTQGPNCPVYLRFYGPGSPIATTDAILTFYFGGDVTTTWPQPGVTTPGGNFALTLFGDGEAWLQERTNMTGGVFDPTAPWRLLDMFQWEVRGKIANRQHVICILPEENDTLNFVGSALQHVFRSDSKSAGMTRKAAMTGDGSIRLDMREDLRCPFQFGTLSFPPGGLGGAPGGTAMYGQPFKIPFRMAAGTSIFADLDHPTGFGGPAGAVDVAIHDANTGALLSGPAGDGSYATATDSQRDYYPIYTPTRPTGFYTPFWRGCNFRVEGAVVLQTPTAYTGGQVMEVAITGPDTEIDCDMASVLIEDEQGLLAAGAPGEGGLDAHAETHVQIRTTYDSALPSNDWVLFDGMVVRAPAVRTGRDFGGGASQYPAVKWKTLRLQLAGMWHRLSEPWQLFWNSKEFTKDPSGAIDPATGRPYPWQIIDIIKDALKTAGFDDSQMQILNPDGGTTNGPRLFADGKNPQYYWVQPGVRIADLVHHMARDYLGCRVIWDKEALPHGRWLTVYPPILNGSYSTLYTFRTASPADAPKMPVHLPGVWPTGTTFVTNYTTWVTPPEANLFIVCTAPSANLPAHDPKAAPGQDIRYVKDGGTLAAAVGVNWRSTYFDGYPAPDPTSLDWVPYGIKPSVTVDPALWTGSVEGSNEACRFVCRRQMALGAYGLKWFQWLAPLVAYFDPDAVYGGGPRTFRTYDLVDFNEDGTIYTVMLTSCNPQIGLPEGDMFQQAQMEGFVLPVPLSY
jgi:hypothetical protein